MSEPTPTAAQAALLARLDAIREADIDGLSEDELAAFWREASPLFATPTGDAFLLPEAANDA